MNPNYTDGQAIKSTLDADRWYAAEIDAAEQRGAIKALRDAAGAIEKNNIVFDGKHYQPCNSCMSIHMNWLDYRADRVKGTTSDDND